MKRFALPFLIALTLLVSGCSGGTGFDSSLKTIVQPYRFSIAGWEFHALVIQPFSERFLGPQRNDTVNSDVIQEYYSDVSYISTIKSEMASANVGSQEISDLESSLQAVQKRQTVLAPEVERIIQSQVREALTGLGIFNPTVRGRIGFPPVWIRVDELPMVLVVSPREKIESMREIVVDSGLPVDTQESIEARVDKLGVSSLVTDIGGMATYPSLIENDASLSSTIYIAAHEWMHQYLAFTPLGFRYVLDEAGIARNYDIALMNETVADIAGREIQEKVLQKYYPGLAGEPVVAGTGQVSEFTLEMREIRKNVDVYLAKGEIAQAENYMEQQRQVLAAQGYYIRKLNQAYFAFNGAYADNPAFINPIGQELQQLRDKSVSLKDFVNEAAGMAGPQDLTASLK